MKIESFPKQDESGKKSHGVSRREFLRAAGGAMAGVAFGSAVAKSGEARERQKAHSPETSAQLLKDWREIKKILEEEKVGENIKYLDSYYGRGAQQVLFKTKYDLHLFQSIAETERRSGDLQAEVMAGNLDQASEAYNLFWNRQAIEARRREREAKNGLDARFEGFEQIAGLTSEEVKIQMEKKFNRRWLYGNVGLFRYEDREERQAHYEVAGRASGKGIGAVLLKDENQAVIIYRHKGMRFDELHRLIGHEIGHHNDWENSHRLSIPERLQFLREVTERLQSSDRFYSLYVEVDVPKEYNDQKTDPGAMRYRQAREYWASLIDFYTADPTLEEVLKETSPKDYALAEKWYKRMAEE